jgi:uncharacterized protein YjiS (DUF1127 family)
MEDAMNTTTMTVPAAGGLARLAGAAGTVALRLVEFIRAYGNHRDLQTLANFDDRMLADIGLTRGDVRDAIAEPLWRDPSNILVTRVRERRLRRPGRQRDAQPVPSPSVVPEVGMGRTLARYD